MRRTRPMSEALRELRERLERWRRQREGQRRIPEVFWSEATALARVEGVSWVAGALGLSYPGLRQRARAEGSTGTRAGSAWPGFVELALPGPPGAATAADGWVLEVSGRGGGRLTVRCPRERAADVLALVKECWRGEA